MKGGKYLDNLKFMNDSVEIFKSNLISNDLKVCGQILDENWRKEICMNICEDPPVLYSESECIQYMECDPTQYLINEVECITEEGYPGTQEKVCNKGLIQYTDCTTLCDEEACNYEDDDCDGEIDEGQRNDCDECGLVPEETCDNVDNDCDGLTDENLTKICETDCETNYSYCIAGEWNCTALPPSDEVCDYVDNDCDGEVDEGLDCECTFFGILLPCTNPSNSPTGLKVPSPLLRNSTFGPKAVTYTSWKPTLS